MNNLVKSLRKKIGDEVFGGTIIVNGSIKIKVSKSKEDTLLSQIIKLVKNRFWSKKIS